MTHRRAALLSFFGGAASFWLPDVVSFLAIGDRSRWIAMTVLCPAGALGFYAWICRRRKGETPYGPSSALYQLLGIWMLAPWFMILASNLSPGPPPSMDLRLYLFLLVASLLPPLTLEASAMHGSGYALVLVTLGLPVLHLLKELGRWVVHPRIAFWRRW